mmetsp:Transcript_99221/g.285455  ORF Transcript_99221/g.285455 Transcript_99221/m.285455 type:complete len:297 (-) Transcript_99221:45-935(-)
MRAGFPRRRRRGRLTPHPRAEIRAAHAPQGVQRSHSLPFKWWRLGCGPQFRACNGIQGSPSRLRVQDRTAWHGLLQRLSLRLARQDPRWRPQDRAAARVADRHVRGHPGVGEGQHLRGERDVRHGVRSWCFGVGAPLCPRKLRRLHLAAAPPGRPHAPRGAGLRPGSSAHRPLGPPLEPAALQHARGRGASPLPGSGVGCGALGETGRSKWADRWEPILPWRARFGGHLSPHKEKRYVRSLVKLEGCIEELLACWPCQPWPRRSALLPLPRLSRHPMRHLCTARALRRAAQVVQGT